MQKIVKWTTYCLAVVALGIGGCSSGPAPKLGLIDGNLTPCDKASHCVSSQSKIAESKVEALAYPDALTNAQGRLKLVIDGMPRTTFTAQTEQYWRVEFKSLIFRFVDDVEFLFKTTGRVEVRSGSRVGESDLGVNRRRIEAIRKAFALPENASAQGSLPKSR